MNSKKIHSGQYMPYGDAFDVWEVQADEGMSREDVMAWCRENLVGGSTVPEKKEFFDRYRNDSTFTMADYFAGYVELKDCGGGLWSFTKCRPYCD